MKLIKFEGADKEIIRKPLYKIRSEKTYNHTGIPGTLVMPYKEVYGFPVVCMELTDREVEDIVFSKRLYIAIPVQCDKLTDDTIIHAPMITTTI